MVKRQTFRFAIISGCILLIAGAVLGLIHRSASLERLEAMAERQNVALTRVFANAAWSDFRSYVAKAGLSDPEALRNTAEVDALGQRIKALMQGSSIAKVKLYDREGLTVYSTDRAEIGIRKRNEGFEEAKAGGIANEIERKDQMLSFDGVVTDRNVVSLWERGDWKTFCEMLPLYNEKCWGEGGMHDTAMLLGALGWDRYEGKAEVVTPYFGSSGTGQINAIFPVTPLSA